MCEGAPWTGSGCRQCDGTCLPMRGLISLHGLSAVESWLQGLRCERKPKKSWRRWRCFLGLLWPINHVSCWESLEAGEHRYRRIWGCVEKTEPWGDRRRMRDVGVLGLSERPLSHLVFSSWQIGCYQLQPQDCWKNKAFIPESLPWTQRCVPVELSAKSSESVIYLSIFPISLLLISLPMTDTLPSLCLSVLGLIAPF